MKNTARGIVNNVEPFTSVDAYFINCDLQCNDEIAVVAVVTSKLTI